MVHINLRVLNWLQKLPTIFVQVFSMSMLLAAFKLYKCSFVAPEKSIEVILNLGTDKCL